jgi:hypothetical protein
MQKYWKAVKTIMEDWRAFKSESKELLVTAKTRGLRALGFWGKIGKLFNVY